MDTKGLRFQPIIRVSTEGQAKKGESLNTQGKIIDGFINRLGGTYASGWENYIGQESATPDHDRLMFDAILENADKGIYDALICCDISRWSRDNQKSKEGLKILRDNNIRFFVLGTEYDLFSPEHNFMLGVTTEVSEFQISLSEYKSLTNRIERAKKGYPSRGLPPIGRTWNKDTEGPMKADEKERAKFIDIAEGFVAGEPLEQIARNHRLNKVHLRRTLGMREFRVTDDMEVVDKGKLVDIKFKTDSKGQKYKAFDFQQLGPVFIQHFKTDKFNINTVVITEVPTILSAELIGQVQERLHNNRTIYRRDRDPNNRYLFGKMVFCGHCNYALVGKTIRDKKYGSAFKYYTHTNCKELRNLPCDLVDEKVFRHIYKTLGDVPKLEAAAKVTIPNFKQRSVHEKRLQKKKAQLSRIGTLVNNLTEKIAAGIVPDDKAKATYDKYAEQEQKLTGEISALEVKVNDVPSEIEIKERARYTKLKVRFIKQKTHLTKLLTESYKQMATSHSHYAFMTFDEERAVLQAIFHDPDYKPQGLKNLGKRLGVYFYKVEDGWRYEIRGRLMNMKRSNRPDEDKNKSKRVVKTKGSGWLSRPGILYELNSGASAAKPVKTTARLSKR